MEIVKEKKLPHGVRKFIRTEKNRIRGLVSDSQKQKEMITELYKKAWGREEKATKTPTVVAEAVAPKAVKKVVAKKEATKSKK